MKDVFNPLTFWLIAAVLSLFLFAWEKVYITLPLLPQVNRTTHVLVPQPAPYPEAFSIGFDTNISRQPYYYHSHYQQTPLRSILYYDWHQRAQRIDHPAGSYECVRFYNVVTTGCQLYFLNQGMYRVLSNSQTGVSCCLDLPGIGATPPDWAKRAQPTFRGTIWDSYSHQMAHEFVFHHSTKHHTHSISTHLHTARQTVDTGLPLTFTFPNERQDFHYNLTSLVIGPQDPRLFRLPDGCETIRCDAVEA